MKVCDAASSHPRPHHGQTQVLKPRLHVPRLVMASVRVCLAAQVHTGSLEGVSAKYLSHSGILARRGPLAEIEFSW